MKYYVIRTSLKTSRVEYKQCKTINQWTTENNKHLCWQFSKEGAKNIVNRERKGCGSKFYTYDMIEAG